MARLLLRILVATLAFAASAAITTLHQRVTTNPVFPQTSATIQSVSNDAALNPSAPTAIHCEPPPALPKGLKLMLDGYFPNWRFPDVSDEECETAKRFSGPHAHPEMIRGDFDADGRMDYALLIEQDPEANDRSVVVPMKFYIVAFFNKNHRYRMQVVTDEGGESLLLMRKGDRDYNYDLQREFTYVRDTIFSGFGMGGTSYLYENGRFRAIITSD